MRTRAYIRDTSICQRSLLHTLPIILACLYYHAFILQLHICAHNKAEVISCLSRSHVSDNLTQGGLPLPQSECNTNLRKSSHRVANEDIREHRTI